MLNRNKITIQFIATLSLFVLGGLGIIGVAIISVIGSLWFIFSLSLLYRETKTVKLPNGFVIYSVFQAILFLSLMWSADWHNSFEYILLFFTGGLIWLYFYNFVGREYLEFHFLEKLIIGLVVVFGVLYLIKPFFFGNEFYYKSLFLPSVSNGKHNHIGDLLAIGFILTLYKVILEKKKVWIFTLPWTIFFLLVSFSRSAYLALFLSIYFFVKVNNILEKSKYLAIALFVIIGTIFMIASADKTTLFSRGYFFQSMAGIFYYPFGVGMGNFGVISFDEQVVFYDSSNISTLTHNIVLETIAGLGIFSIPFVVWLIKVCREVWDRRQEKKGLYAAVFICLTVNFFFDYTYVIPTMLWFWFAVLGLIQSNKSATSKNN